MPFTLLLFILFMASVLVANTILTLNTYHALEDINKRNSDRMRYLNQDLELIVLKLEEIKIQKQQNQRVRMAPRRKK